MKIQVEYQMTSYQSHTLYHCLISNYPNQEYKNVKLQGQHVAGKNRNDVVAVKFQNSQLQKIPQNLTKLFPNLKYLIVLNSELWDLKKQDLAEYKELEVIDIRQSLLTFLPGDIFDGFKNIKFIYFMGKELRMIEPNILDGLFSLERAYFVFYNGEEMYQKGAQSYKEFRKGLLTRFCLGGEGIIEDYIKKLEQNDRKFRRIKENLNEKVERLEVSQKILIKNNHDLREEVKIGSINKLTISAYTYLNNDLEQKLKDVNAKYSKGIFGDFKAFIQDETTKDFKIIIEGREFPVHKFLLAARSPTLAEVLKNNPEVENLKLVDVSPEVFEIILTFLYTDELPGDDKINLLHLFSASVKLKIMELMDFAAMKLIGQTSETMVLEILKMSIKNGKEELTRKTFDEVKKRYPKIDFKDEWMNNADKIEEIIKAFENKTAEMQALEEKFQNLLHGK